MEDAEAEQTCLVDAKEKTNQAPPSRRRPESCSSASLGALCSLAGHQLSSRVLSARG